jgi:hypothetical protein
MTQGFQGVEFFLFFWANLPESSPASIDAPTAGFSEPPEIPHSQASTVDENDPGGRPPDGPQDLYTRI